MEGFSRKKKENSSAVDNTNYERVVVVDYGSEQNLNYDDELSESLVEENSSSNQQAEDTASGSNGSVVTDESPQTGNDSEDGSEEYCGILYKSFQSNDYYIKLTSGTLNLSTFKLSLPSNLEYGLMPI